MGLESWRRGASDWEICVRMSVASCLGGQLPVEKAINNIKFQYTFPSF